MKTTLTNGITKKDQKGISIRQAGIILFFLSFGNKILFLPSLLYKYAKTDAFFIYLILFLMEFLILLIFVNLKKKYINTSFFSIFSNIFGTFFAKIIYFLFLFYFLSKIILMFNITYFYLKDQIYCCVNPYIYVICVLPVMNHAMLIDFRAVGRTMELFFHILFFSILLCLAISLINLNSFEGFFISKFSDFSVGFFKHIFTFGDYICMFFIMDKIDYKKGKEKVYFIYALFGAVSVAAIALIYYLIFSNTAFMHCNAFSDIINFSNNYGEIGRLDIISMLIIMFLTFFQINIYGKCFQECFTKTFDKLTKVYSVVVFDIVFLICVLVFFTNLQITIFTTENIFPFFSILSFIIIPFVSCVALIKKKGKIKYEKTF